MVRAREELGRHESPPSGGVVVLDLPQSNDAEVRGDVARELKHLHARERRAHARVVERLLVDGQERGLRERDDERVARVRGRDVRHAVELRLRHREHARDVRDRRLDELEHGHVARREVPVLEVSCDPLHEPGLPVALWDARVDLRGPRLRREGQAERDGRRLCTCATRG